MSLSILLLPAPLFLMDLFCLNLKRKVGRALARTKMLSEDQAYAIEIGNRITARREEIGMKACGLAGLVGITETMLSRIENGKVATSCIILAKIAKVLKVSLSELQPLELDVYSDILPETRPLIEEIKKIPLIARQGLIGGFVQTIRALRP